jgi:hypothetical protein
MLLATRAPNHCYRTYSNLIWSVPNDGNESWRNSGRNGKGRYRPLVLSTLATTHPSILNYDLSYQVLVDRWQLLRSPQLEPLGPYLTMPHLGVLFCEFSLPPFSFTFQFLQFGLLIQNE